MLSEGSIKLLARIVLVRLGPKEASAQHEQRHWRQSRAVQDGPGWAGQVLHGRESSLCTGTPNHEPEGRGKEGRRGKGEKESKKMSLRSAHQLLTAHTVFC